MLLWLLVNVIIPLVDHLSKNPTNNNDIRIIDIILINLLEFESTMIIGYWSKNPTNNDNVRIVI